MFTYFILRDCYVIIIHDTLVCFVLQLSTKSRLYSDTPSNPF